jgi:hypothetical protein
MLKSLSVLSLLCRASGFNFFALKIPVRCHNAVTNLSVQADQWLEGIVGRGF